MLVSDNRRLRNASQLRMRNHQRENSILQLLGRQDVLSVTELAQCLDVSDATVRRDLQAMEERGLLRRIHGGATLQGISRIEPFFADKEGLHTAAKQAIAEAALAHIEDGSVIYLDGGSTVLMLARLLDRRRNLTVVTNSLMAAASLMDTAHRLILAGGEFRSISRTTVGPLTSCVLSQLHVHQAFMGTIGFALDDGMTTTDPGEAYTKALVMKRARHVVLLADSSKFGVHSFARCGDLSDVSCVITEHVEPDVRQALERRGIELELAGAAARPTP